jgi:hypothetical protein
MAPFRDRQLGSHNSQPVMANPIDGSLSHKDSHAAATGEQTVSTFLPPFSGKLKVDKELKLGHGDFKKSIKDYYKKPLSVIGQLKKPPPYPISHTLAPFAKLAYHKYN